MKKILFTIVITLAFTGCSEESAIEQPSKEVEVSLNYSFMESGNMTRTGSTVYTDFYNKYIKTKQLTPTSYSLTFKNKESGTIATINGLWKNKDGVKLIEGEYEVTGVSYPAGKTTFNNCISDTLYLTFNEDVNIGRNSSLITLTAKYDSYMLLFDNSNADNVIYNVNENLSNEHFVLPQIDESFYAFIHSFYWNGNTNPNRISIKRKDGKYSHIELDKVPFEKGKYYYLNDIDNSFNIPPMEEGN